MLTLCATMLLNKVNYREIISLLLKYHSKYIPETASK